MIFIKNAHIKPIVGSEIESGCILLSDGKIAAIGADLIAPEVAQVIDAGGRLVTPGIIEAHCHVGLHNQNIRWEGADYNEKGDPITPHMRAIDGFNPQDGMLADAIRGGVTTVCTGPGSANVVGGTFVITKMAGKRIDDMAIVENAAMKCAFGENPKSVYGQNKKSPYTRMATAALLRELLFKARNYMEEKNSDKPPKFDMYRQGVWPEADAGSLLRRRPHCRRAGKGRLPRPDRPHHDQ